MKKIILSALLFCAVAVSAQVKTRPLKKVAELQMPRTTDDDYPGTRGASVAWHPLQKKYYASMAGNYNYPLAVFDATGKRLSEDGQNCLIDVRGLWYNPITKTIHGNGFDTVGWFSYKLDAKGMVSDLNSVFEGRNQPDKQCVGAFNPLARTVLFLFDGEVFSYQMTDGLPTGKSTIIYWGVSVKTDQSEDESGANAGNYNSTTVVYTAIPKAQYGFLNTVSAQIELYDSNTGLLTQILSLPEGTPTPGSFNFAYTNGIYWIFDMDNRVWLGYK